LIVASWVCAMPRTVRVTPGGIVFHVLNRANARSRIFESDLDYQPFKGVIIETVKLIPIEIFACSIMQIRKTDTAEQLALRSTMRACGRRREAKEKYWTYPLLPFSS
jgi:hypothetical protein